MHKLNPDYWPQFWQRHGIETRDQSRQIQVLRTLLRQPIQEEEWRLTLAWVRSKLSLEGGHDLLDLCCGNGLFAEDFFPSCDTITAVDVSDELLTPLKAIGSSKIRPIAADMRSVDFRPGEFDRVLWYAAIQYLTSAEALQVLLKTAEWLRPGGILYVGDVPDADCRWIFFNTPEREAAYFRSLLDGEPIVGNWFKKDWLCRAAAFAGFSSVQVLAQPEFMIYSKYRFDVLLVR